MPAIPFADNFLAGSIISLLIPAGLLIAFAVWYVTAVKRIGESGRSKAADASAASSTTTGGAAEPPRVGP
jgi:hypothetical protein